MTYEVYRYAARGYYESHKTLYTLLMALKIQLASKDVKHKEFLTFIKGKKETCYYCEKILAASLILLRTQDYNAKS